MTRFYLENKDMRRSIRKLLSSMQEVIDVGSMELPYEWWLQPLVSGKVFWFISFTLFGVISWDLCADY